ncbi:hypothetical protein Val02_53010 [Virgisporangium aliadipatigenens]|uniref:CU044_5270 family protein n=1 Tax=Virgisporangium aliadipatigenens TaxID=741659 RepID=A0A8J4DRR4_9ACTN|nr:hypothetical protein [Virgisporangium aliadipatigenens]GIJ48415.1 hypothetical protein Val02_53010 [Virgisporangium aliadipatigenens]
MPDIDSIRAALGPADPARGTPVPPPRVTAADLIARTGEPHAPGRFDRRVGRRLVLGPVALGVAAAVAYPFLRRESQPPSSAPPSSPSLSGSPSPSAPLPASSLPPPPRIELGPVVRPVVLQYEDHAPPAGDRLRELAGQLADAPYDGTSGPFTYIHTLGWNAVFDDRPGGTSQRIPPTEKELWYRPDDGSGRLRVTVHPDVYPNEESARYWREHPMPSPTGTPPPVYDDLPAGRAGPTRTMPTDPAALRVFVGRDPVRGLRNLYGYYAVARDARAGMLRILADVPGIAWRGETTDRAGRGGIAVSVETDTAREVLVFDPRTGVLLMWDEVSHEQDTVAGCTLYLRSGHTDQTGT